MAPRKSVSKTARIVALSTEARRDLELAVRFLDEIRTALHRTSKRLEIIAVLAAEAKGANGEAK